MGISISQLPAGSSPTGVELVPAVQSSTTVSLTVEQIAALYATPANVRIWGTDSGTANNYVFTHAGNLAASQTPGLVLCFMAKYANTGASSIIADGLGGISIYSASGLPLKGGEIQTSVPTWLQWNGGVWQLLGNSLWVTNEVAFTPACAFLGGGSITQSVLGAAYSQIGNVLTFQFYIQWTAISSPTGTLQITGMPVPPKSAISGGPVFHVYVNGITFNGYLTAYLPSNSTEMTIIESYSGGTADLQGSAFGSTGQILCSGSYQV